MVAGSLEARRGTGLCEQLPSRLHDRPAVEFATGAADRRHRVQLPAPGGRRRRSRSPSCCSSSSTCCRAGIQAYERGEQLEQRTRELASLQVGLINTVMQTLSMRDAMTARHSAAVARYAREVAACSASPSASRSSSTPPACSTTSASSSSPTRSSSPTGSSPTRSGRSSSCTPSRAPSSSGASRATALSPTSCSATTRRSTGPATRTASAASTSRWGRASSRRPTPTTS